MELKPSLRIPNVQYEDSYSFANNISEIEGNKNRSNDQTPEGLSQLNTFDNFQKFINKVSFKRKVGGKGKDFNTIDKYSQEQTLNLFKNQPFKLVLLNNKQKLPYSYLNYFQNKNKTQNTKDNTLNQKQVSKSNDNTLNRKPRKFIRELPLVEDKSQTFHVNQKPHFKIQNEQKFKNILTEAKLNQLQFQQILTERQRTNKSSMYQTQNYNTMTPRDLQLSKLNWKQFYKLHKQAEKQQQTSGRKSNFSEVDHFTRALLTPQEQIQQELSQVKVQKHRQKQSFNLKTDRVFYQDEDLILKNRYIGNMVYVKKEYLKSRSSSRSSSSKSVARRRKDYYTIYPSEKLMKLTNVEINYVHKQPNLNQIQKELMKYPKPPPFMDSQYKNSQQRPKRIYSQQKNKVSKLDQNQVVEKIYNLIKNDQYDFSFMKETRETQTKKIEPSESSQDFNNKQNQNDVDIINWDDISQLTEFGTQDGNFQHLDENTFFGNKGKTN